MEGAYTIGMTLVSFISMCFVWRMWKSAMREVLRDKLIDLRDEWRNYYIDHSLDMNDGRYAMQRDIINAMLSGTASLRFVGFWYFMTHIDDRTLAYSANMTAKLFENSSEDMRKTISSIRMRASLAVLCYIATTSIGIVFYIPYKMLATISSVLAEKTICGMKNLFTVNDDAIVCASSAYKVSCA